jgi:ring-1,2-phenylacetyl-CoA epoxidase subunit PaaC
LNDLWVFTGDMFHPSVIEKNAMSEGIGPDVSSLNEEWMSKVQEVFREANLQVPAQTWMQKGGKEGIHTEYLGYLLAEMQYLQRTYPNATW